jgi:uncharacterized protein YegL
VPKDAEKRPLIVVVDTSGSMNEMGKLMLALNLTAYVDECIRMSTTPSVATQLKIIEWGEVVGAIEPKKILQGPPYPAPNGRAEVSKLLTLLDQTLEDGQQEQWILLLTDGAFRNSDFHDFECWVNKRSKLTLRVVAIGPDADIHQLKRISDLDPFSPENISLALESFLVVQGQNQSAPVGMKDISLIN